MSLNQNYSLQTGVVLEISAATLHHLIKSAAYEQRTTALIKIRRPADLYDYLSVIVHQDAHGLIKRRHAWAKKIKGDLLAGKPVSFKNFDNLFWRHLDEEDPDGDEWYRLIADERFHFQLTSLLDTLRSVERRLHQTINTPSDLNLGLGNVDMMTSDISLFQY
ncbi:hypothetical protein SAMN05216419_10451 [Nitrosomonas cryotolerans]|uniref:Uncharacterized protein n=1 Tax=Nitrosomonas cryotolerans ATCC 49181 TaxID=1131553 RepID=A0A1N6FCV8_9PROT|nr:hypothetical protein [Nitrosomonas cryotolerans]SFQ00695.1 hypothetical protein SAMN05216419_10451 [Nitrosomonas cryotolerans]SIN93121.1 hypothetical protein SAMN02743940_0200 [Nitrosomonas cryotolerans ATCC 49181]